MAKGKDNQTTLVVSAGQWGQILGRLDVDFDGRGQITGWRGEPLVVRCDAAHECKGDAALERRLDETMKPVLTVTDRVLTRLPHPLTPSADGESELGLRMADATLRAARRFGATLAIAEGDFRGGLPSGDVTYGDVYAAWPFDVRIVVVDLTGTELQPSPGRARPQSGVWIRIWSSERHLPNIWLGQPPSPPRDLRVTKF